MSTDRPRRIGVPAAPPRPTVATPPAVKQPVPSAPSMPQPAPRQVPGRFKPKPPTPLPSKGATPVVAHSHPARRDHLGGREAANIARIHAATSYTVNWKERGMLSEYDDPDIPWDFPTRPRYEIPAIRGRRPRA